MKTEEYNKGYAQAVQDVADLLYATGGAAGPTSHFTYEGKAAVDCMAYALKYHGNDLNLHDEVSEKLTQLLKSKS